MTGIILKDIRRRDDGTVLISINVGNEFGSEKIELVILEELFEEISPLRESLDARQLDTLDKMAETTAAYRSALSSLGFVQSSHKALYRKLISKGHSKAACESAIMLIREKAYIDESSLALRRAELMIEKHKGKSRIIAKLYEEGFGEDALEDVKEYLHEIDFSEFCAETIKKKYGELPADRKEKEKMYASLMRAGFSGSDIKTAIRKIEDDG